MTRRKETGEIITLAGCIGRSENGQFLYQTQISEHGNTCEILEESEIIFEHIF